MQDETEHHQPRAKRAESPGREMVYLPLNVRNKRRQNGAENTDRSAKSRAHGEIADKAGEQRADRAPRIVAETRTGANVRFVIK